MKKKKVKDLNGYLNKMYLSEDLQTSMKILYSFFHQNISIDYSTLVIYDAKKHTLQYRIHSTNTSVVLVDELITFSEDTRKDAQALMETGRMTSYIPNGMKHPLVRQFDIQVGIDQPASIIMHSVEIAPDQYALLNLVVWGESRHKQEHIDFVEELAEPINSALRFIYSQLVIAQLRERLLSDSRSLRKRLQKEPASGTPGLQKVMLRIKQVAKLDTPVLISGETGVGKELMANSIHRLSRRANGPLISVNCGAITETLLDDELFGHEKGAFTGAGNMKTGFFEQAHGGSIFLDEVSELSKKAQVKLLRVLQDMTFQRVGGQRPISVDTRVIAATNRDIETMVANGEFRKDLWFRLNTFPIAVPPLRERKDDIPILAQFFTERFKVEMNLPYSHRFAPEAMAQLQKYHWPGNIRELENVIERALIINRGAPLSFSSLDEGRESISMDTAGEQAARVLTLDEAMRNHINKVLKITGGRIEGRGGAAEILDVKPSTLRARMKRLGIRRK